MTVNPVNNPFHYMSAPVLSAFGLDFPNTLVELRNSYVNLMQSLGINGKWFLLPSDDNLILISKHGFNSSSAPVITMTIEIHHSQHWFLRHAAGILCSINIPCWLHCQPLYSLVMTSKQLLILSMNAATVRESMTQNIIHQFSRIMGSFMIIKVCGY